MREQSLYDSRHKPRLGVYSSRAKCINSRSRSKDRVGLAGASLPVGQDCPVIAFQHAAQSLSSHSLQSFTLSGARLADSVELKLSLFHSAFEYC